MAKSRTRTKSSSSSSERSRRLTEEDIEKLGRDFDLSELTVIVHEDGRVTFSDLPQDILDVIEALGGEDERSDSSQRSANSKQDKDTKDQSS